MNEIVYTDFLNNNTDNNVNKPNFKKIILIVVSAITTILILVSISFYFIFVFHGTQTASIEPAKPKNIDMSSYLCNIYAEQQNQIKKEKELTPLTDEQYNKIKTLYTSTTEKTVFLTFDDGPSKNVTPLILDLLKQENVKATFFVLGSNVNYHPELVQREYNEGHYIANHGYTHSYSNIYVSSETILNDYLACNQAIKKALNNESYESKVYRYPGGSTGGRYHNIKAEGKELLKENHIAYLDWNALTRDAEGTPTKESIIENLHSTVGDKNVVVLLMHDSSSKILTYETLPEVISFFKNNGYTFKTIYDIL